MTAVGRTRMRLSPLATSGHSRIRLDPEARKAKSDNSFHEDLAMEQSRNASPAP